MDTNQNPSKSTPKIKRLHAESDSDNNQTISNNQIISTNTYVLNFNTQKPPTEIKIGYLITKVETYSKPTEMP